MGCSRVMFFSQPEELFSQIYQYQKSKDYLTSYLSITQQTDSNHHCPHGLMVKAMD